MDNITTLVVHLPSHISEKSPPFFDPMDVMTPVFEEESGKSGTTTDEISAETSKSTEQSSSGNDEEDETEDPDSES